MKNGPVAILFGLFSCMFWTGASSAQVATLSNTTIPFGNVAVLATSTKNLTITNTGTSNLVISSITATGNFQSANCNNATISPSHNCVVSVSFTPAALGSSSGTLTITDSDPSSPQLVTLTGTGIVPVTINPSTLAFPNQAIGTPSLAKTVTLTNNQAVALTITSVAASGAYTANSCPASLAAQSSCVISVTFTPTVLGSNTGTLTVVDSANNSPQTASLSGPGVQPVTFSLTQLNFGSQVIDTTSTAKTVTLTNNQSVALNISSITASAGFSASNCATPMAAYGSCAISVSFTPTSTGSITGTLTVTDDANTSPQTLSLAGTGAGAVSLSPSALQFSSQVVGTTSPSMTISLINNQSTALAVTSVSTTGPYAASSCPASLAAGTTCAISVTFTPTAAGHNSGTLTVSDGAGQQAATLQGTGAAVQLTSIAVTPANPSAALGITQQFTATGTYNNGTTAPISNPTWASSNANVATVGTTGLATTVATGSTTISATSGGVTGTATLTVNPPALVSIAVTPSNTSMTNGTSQQFTATGTYTNGSTVNLTSSVSWSSSNSAVATVTVGGLITGTGVGSTSITAAFGSVSGSTNLSVSSAILTSIALTPLNSSVALA